jgi:3-dehydroquinate synthase
MDMAGPFVKLRGMPHVTVDLAERSYQVIVETGLLQRVVECLREQGFSQQNIALISDTTVAKLHAAPVIDQLTAAGRTVTLHMAPAGEASKSISQTEAVCREMIRSGHDRKSLVIALGGGVVGDLAGFIAAVFYRGIPFIQIPTTIVSQVDSSVGGKTGVNVVEGKNLLGSFHQPSLVLIDPETLKTLPDREYREGFAEAIKHAAIRDESMLADLEALDPESRDVPADLLARNIAIKARIVEQDEHETTGLRALLNFGHTIGHGIEASLPYGEMLHGEAISLGIRAALHVSEEVAGLSPEHSLRIMKLLDHFHLPTLLAPEIPTERVMEKLARDKKFVGGAIRFVVLDAPGNARVSQDVTPEQLREAIECLRQPI